MQSKDVSRIFNKSRDKTLSSTLPSSIEELESFASFNFVFDNTIRFTSSSDGKNTIEESRLCIEKQKQSFAKIIKDTSSLYERINKLFGEISYVDGQSFYALLTDSNDGISREVEFCIDEIQESDFPKVEVGRRIIFLYGKEIVNGTYHNFSKIIFRDNPIWSNKSIERYRNKADSLFELLKIKSQDEE